MSVIQSVTSLFTEILFVGSKDAFWSDKIPYFKSTLFLRERWDLKSKWVLFMMRQTRVISVEWSHLS